MPYTYRVLAGISPRALPAPAGGGGDLIKRAEAASVWSRRSLGC